MCTALAQVFNDAKGVVEGGCIVRQRYAAEIAVLTIKSPDIEKISRQGPPSVTPVSRYGLTRQWAQELSAPINLSEGLEMAAHTFNSAALSKTKPPPPRTKFAPRPCTSVSAP
jgi:hypothetical protein